MNLVISTTHLGAVPSSRLKIMKFVFSICLEELTEAANISEQVDLPILIC